ncbi:Uncharacterised protein [Mycobacteroides abscessus subsp. bolletii]|nr:Uncharacterised protein [Mycobacteroides abscessus subsp. bolletii]
MSGASAEDFARVSDAIEALLAAVRISGMPPHRARNGICGSWQTISSR